MDANKESDIVPPWPDSERVVGDAAPVKCWRCFLNNKPTASQCEYCEAPFEKVVAEPIDEIACWRCQKTMQASSTRCVYCDAHLTQDEHHRERQASSQWKHGIVAMIGHYSLALLILVVGGWSVSFGVHHAGKNDEAVFREVLPILATTELLFLALAVAAYFHLRKECAPASRQVRSESVGVGISPAWYYSRNQPQLPLATSATISGAEFRLPLLGKQPLALDGVVDLHSTSCCGRTLLSPGRVRLLAKSHELARSGLG